MKVFSTIKNDQSKNAIGLIIGSVSFGPILSKHAGLRQKYHSTQNFYGKCLLSQEKNRYSQIKRRGSRIMTARIIRHLFLSIISALFLPQHLLATTIEVTDFLGNTLVLERPTERIVSLAPHITENIFAVGAGSKIVGTVSYSDFPKEAEAILKIGSHDAFSLEEIISLKPDLVIVWTSGSGTELYQKLRTLGLNVYASNPRSLQDIPKSLLDYAKLTGNEKTGFKAAHTFEKRHKYLKQTYSSNSPVSTFYQVWHSPILTINKNSLISDVIELCGGKNVFSDAAALVPKLSVESVLVKNPEAIIASGMADERPKWLQEWRSWKNIDAVRNNHLFFVPPDLIQRHSIRVLEGAEIICQQLDTVRKKRVSELDKR